MKLCFVIFFTLFATIRVVAMDFDASGRIDAVLGADNDLDFNDNTSEREFYNAYLGKIRYFLYLRADHDGASDLVWLNTPDDGWSYIRAYGFATKATLTDSLALKFDFLFAESDNCGDRHNPESSGFHSAIIFDYQLRSTIIGGFAWYSTGSDQYLIINGDYGVAPSINRERSFSPTRLGFKGDSSVGRDATLADTGLGTTGGGIHIKDFSFINELKHTLRIAYIAGTTKDLGAGAPPAITVLSNTSTNPSLPTPRTEYGMMTAQDYAMEFNLDSTYNFTENFMTIIELGYILSYFDDKQYNKDIFNAQLILRYNFHS